MELLTYIFGLSLFALAVIDGSTEILLECDEVLERFRSIVSHGTEKALAIASAVEGNIEFELDADGFPMEVTEAIARKPDQWHFKLLLWAPNEPTHRPSEAFERYVVLHAKNLGIKGFLAVTQEATLPRFDAAAVAYDYNVWLDNSGSFNYLQD